MMDSLPPKVALTVLEYVPKKNRMDLLVANKALHLTFAKALYNNPALNEMESFEKLMGFLNIKSLSVPYYEFVEQLNFTGMAADNVYMGDLDACLKLCKNLKILRLERCFHISNVLVQSISKHCPQLEQLDLPGCPLSDSVIPELTERCVNLKRVDFSFTNMSVASLFFLIKNCPGIEEVDLSECKDVEEMPDLSAPCGLSALTYLNLRNSLVTDPILRFVARQCPKLKTLILESCSDLSDSGVMKVANSCLQLVTLDLSFCHLVSDLSVQVFTIRAASNNGGKLQELHLAACEKISATAILQLVQKANKLELLVLDGCDKLNGTAVKALATYNGDDITCTFEVDALKQLAELPLDQAESNTQLITPPTSPKSKNFSILSRKKSRSLLSKRHMESIAPSSHDDYVEAQYEERAQKIKSKRQSKAATGSVEERDPVEIKLEQEKAEEKEKKLAMRRSMGSLSLGEKYVIPQRTGRAPTLVPEGLSWKSRRKSQTFAGSSNTAVPNVTSTANSPTVLLASGRRNRSVSANTNRHTISTDVVVTTNAGWGKDPEHWVNPTQMTANSSTWSVKGPVVAPVKGGFVDPWATPGSEPKRIRTPSWQPKESDIKSAPIPATNPWNLAPTPIGTFTFSGTNRGKILLKLKVETKKGGHQDLIVHEYDDPTKLASEFCAFWDMTSFKAPLIRLITIRKNNAIRTKAPLK